MEEIRYQIDKLELTVADELWTLPLWTTSNLATIVKTDWVCILRDSLKLTSCLVCFGWFLASR